MGRQKPEAEGARGQPWEAIAGIFVGVRVWCRKSVGERSEEDDNQVRRELTVLASALSHAVKNGRLSSSPRIVMPPNAPHRTRYLERDEIERLLGNCIEPHIRLFVLLALNTGSRKGAILDLRWPQVDMVNKIIHLNPLGILRYA
jgi:integrase